MWRAIASAVIFYVVLTASAAAEIRVALVVGNSDYTNVTRLPNPTSDARLVAETLAKLGFTLVGGGAQLDLDKPHFDLAVQAFGRQLMGADVGLFYYAGHGVQVRGANYLVPISANPTREADVDFQMMDVGLVLKQMEGSGTKLNVVMLDACRNNPFSGRGLRSTEGGLAQIRAPEGTLLSYATQPGNVALDGDDGHSPYTRALVEAMQRPGLDVLQAFNQVGLAVKRATGSSQQPWISSSPIEGSFYFAGPGGAQVATADPTNVVLPPTTAASSQVTAAAPTNPPPAITAGSQAKTIGPEFVFPDSNTRLLTSADLQGRSSDELRIARNEIFARRGRYFDSPELMDHFGKYAWYKPSTWNPRLNPIEEANVQFLNRLEPSIIELIFPDSDRRRLTAAELSRLSKPELRIAKNEIFARRGRYFESPDLKAHFARYSWYSPSTWDPKLNPIEQANVALIVQFEKR